MKFLMGDYEFSAHAYNVLKARAIPEEWVRSALAAPDRLERKGNDERHHIKKIDEFGGRHLRVVVNWKTKPERIITVFFDRRLGR